MKQCLVCLVAALGLLSLVHAADKTEGGRYLAKPLKGDYYVYGGSIGDKEPPSPKDRKVSFMLTGPLAKELFDHIGRDAKDSCSPGPDYRERNRGDLTCIWTKEDGYSCYFGLNGQTGKSMRGVTC
jgi:hypothetical protein